MKINVTVDLTDFYGEEEAGSFSDQIKSDIAWKVKQQVIGDFKESGMQIVSGMATKLIEQNLKKELESIVRQIVNTRKAKDGKTLLQLVKEKVDGSAFYGNSVKVDEVMRNAFSDVERNINALVTQKAKDLAQELKDRYDLFFASQIVAKMNEQGLLKEGVAELLLKK